MGTASGSSLGTTASAPVHGTPKLVQEFSVETEYLPNMDPLHGSLNMISSLTSKSRSVETDADKEVGNSVKKKLLLSVFKSSLPYG